MTRTKIPSFAIEDSAEYPETAAGTHLPFYCINCYRKRETTYLTPNFGPFCDECLEEVEPLLKPRNSVTIVHVCEKAGMPIIVNPCIACDIERADETTARVMHDHNCGNMLPPGSTGCDCGASEINELTALITDLCTYLGKRAPVSPSCEALLVRLVKLKRLQEKITA